MVPAQDILLPRADYGIVVSFEAPLLDRPSLYGSQVIQMVSRGDKIFLHSQDIRQSNDIVDGKYAQGFFKTLDRRGEDAYIERRFVKVIYNDKRELQSSIRPYKNHDPRDYRLEEPLPDFYPFVEFEKYKTQLSFALGPSQRAIYPYPQKTIREDYRVRRGLSFMFGRRIPSDKSNRFFLGGKSHLLFQTSELFFEDFNIESKESLAQWGVGPYISYTFLRSENYYFDIYGAATINYHRLLIQMRDPQFAENRLFTGFSLTPQLGTQIVYPDFFPLLGLIIGLEAQYNIRSRLGPRDEGGEVEGLWRGDKKDRFNLSTGGNYTVYVGLQRSF